MDQLFLSMMKLSTAAMMFGLERVGEGARSLRSDGDRHEAAARMRDSVDRVTAAMRGEMSEAKSDVVDSMSRVTEELAGDLRDREIADPAEFVRSAGDLFKKSADALADWLDDQGAADEASGAEPTPDEATGEGRGSD